MSSIVLSGATSGSTTISPTDTVTITCTLPSTGGTIQTSGAGYTTNGVAYASSTSALATGSGLVWTGGTAQLGFQNAAASGYAYIGSSGAGTNKDLSFYMGATNVMTLNNSGQLGIGTPSPASTLDLQATQTVLGLTSTTGTNSASINIKNNSGSTAFYIGIDNSTGSNFTGTAYAPFLWSQNAYPIIFGTSNAERMRLDSSGTLIINATAKVSGTTYLSVQGSTATSNIMEQKDTGTSYASGNYYQVYFNSTNGVAGGVAHTAATTVAFNTSSDVRLKKNIVDAPSALDKVVAAQVRSFDWKDDDRHVEYGFIAQELFQHFPEAVGKGDDAAEIESPKSTWQVEYGRLTPMLVKAIQELSTLITAQQSTIQSLTERITALENK